MVINEYSQNVSYTSYSTIEEEKSSFKLTWMTDTGAIYENQFVVERQEQSFDTVINKNAPLTYNVYAPGYEGGYAYVSLHSHSNQEVAFSTTTTVGNDGYVVIEYLQDDLAPLTSGTGNLYISVNKEIPQITSGTARGGKFTKSFYISQDVTIESQ